MKDHAPQEETCPLCLMLLEEMRYAVPYEEIVRRGVSLPPAELMTDQQLARKIDELISALAGLRICVTSTDHLSDRKLYELLCNDRLREMMEIYEEDVNGVVTIDIIGGGSEEDIEIYLTYYADDETRQLWAIDFPDDPIPEKKPRPYDRDRFLPTLETLMATESGH